MVALLAMVAFGAGCRSESACVRTVSAAPAQDLIFNPAWSIYPQADVARTPWPTTDTGDPLSRETVYSIQIIDTQDPWLHAWPTYYRRAEAIQYGRSRR
jgi:hypothetical protein